MKKENVIQEKSFQFALKVIGLYKILTAQKEFIISKQIKGSFGSTISLSFKAKKWLNEQKEIYHNYENHNRDSDRM